MCIHVSVIQHLSLDAVALIFKVGSNRWSKEQHKLKVSRVLKWQSRMITFQKGKLRYTVNGSALRLTILFQPYSQGLDML
jgi:hypothetical protein